MRISRKKFRAFFEIFVSGAKEETKWRAIARVAMSRFNAHECVLEMRESKGPVTLRNFLSSLSRNG